ncbi:MAG: transglycosylase family protein [Acidimicrobiales bacterium]
MLLSARSSGDGPTVIEATTAAVAESSVVVSDIDVDVSRLFDAGADETEMSADGLIDGSGLQRELVANTTPPGEASDPAPDRPAIYAPIDPSSPTNPPSTNPPSTKNDNKTSGDAAAPIQATPKAPTTDAPPTTAAPTTAAPTTAAPTTAAPTTATPATKPPATNPPATDPPATEASGSGEPTADQWANLRQCESGGSYTIVSGNGLYYGAYQFGKGTWDTIARQAGRADLVGVLPSDASSADQDAMALALWRRSGAQPWPHCGKYLS